MAHPCFEAFFIATGKVVPPLDRVDRTIDSFATSVKFIARKPRGRQRPDAPASLEDAQHAAYCYGGALARLARLKNPDLFNW